MGHPGSPPEVTAPFVADASLWITLAATDCAAEILSALARRTIIADIALTELERGRLKGWNAADVVAALLASGHAEVVILPPSALDAYCDLVIGEGPETLDDGEAATLALAHALGGTAVVDERKARRLAQARFPGLRLRCTAELLLAPEVFGALGMSRAGDAIFAALQISRMRVPSTLIGFVINAIGHDRARQCPSLPARSRTPPFESLTWRSGP